MFLESPKPIGTKQQMAMDFQKTKPPNQTKEESPEETKQTDQSFTMSHATPTFELNNLLPKEVADHLPPEILMSL